MKDKFIDKLQEALKNPEDWNVERINSTEGLFVKWYSDEFTLKNEDTAWFFIESGFWGIHISHEDSRGYSRYGLNWYERLNPFNKKLREVRKSIKEMKKYHSDKREDKYREGIEYTLNNLDT